MNDDFDDNEAFRSWHPLKHASLKRCNHRCGDPICGVIGCMNIAAWNFRNLIMKGYKVERDEAEAKERKARSKSKMGR